MLSKEFRVYRGALGVVVSGFLAGVMVLAGCATNSDAYRSQQTFASPAAAAEALGSAAQRGATAELESIFGTDARSVLSSGDPVADANQREVFSVAFSQGWSLERTNSKTQELIVGHEKWPFPIPLVKDGRGWWFDTGAGAEEIQARRIGRNELAAIRALHIYVVAQRDYAKASRDGQPPGVYAQRIRSDPDKHNGLYWATNEPTEPRSPLAELVADATSAGYGKNPEEGPAPYNGYFFRILTQQGPAAPGGTRDYVVDGNMTGGFAMIAFPADYGNSGIMTFQVGPDDVVYQADLGEETSTVAGATVAFNPGPGWRIVK